MCQLRYAALHQLCSQSVMAQNNDDSRLSEILIYFSQLSELWSVKWDKKATKIVYSITNGHKSILSDYFLYAQLS